MKLFYCVWAIVLPLCVRAQTKTIRGSVHDAQTGKPLADVSLRLRHAQHGGHSDAAGNFIFYNVVIPDTIDVFMVGYRLTTVPVDSITSINILLEQTSNALDSVLVSTGYQKIPKERATGSFGFVNNALLNRSVSSNVLDRIDNVVPGLLFNHGDAANTDALLIRGRSTIYANAAPLIVVDNFPYDGDMSNINPNDIESITVLKDAAAASIWGARAGNGVIVITTKKGKSATTAVQLNSNVTVIQKPDLFNINSISSADYTALEEDLFARGYYANDELYDSWDYGHPPLTPVVELLIAKRDGMVGATDAAAQIAALKGFDVRNDMERYLYRTGINQQHALNISGNTDKLNYYFSAGWDKGIGNLVGAGSNRITLRTQQTLHVSKRLQADMGMQFTENISSAGNNPGYLLNSGYGKSIYPYARLADDAGNPAVLVKDNRLAFTEAAAHAGLLNWQYSPITDIAANELRSRNTDYLIQASIHYTIMTGMQAELRYQYEDGATGITDYHSADSYFTRNLINSFTQVDAGTGALSYPVPLGAIMNTSEGVLRSHQGRATLSYNKAWDERQQVTVLAGWEIKDLQQRRITDRLYGYDPDRSIAATDIDYVTRFVQYYNIYLQSNITNSIAVQHMTDRFISSFANVAYTYDNRYTISASARQDAANLFGVATNQRGAPLWSVGGAWQVNHEKYYHSKLLPQLKVRATYGYNGNISRLASAFTTVSFYTANNTPLTTATIMNPPNKNLRWEKVNMLNLGIDFSLRNNVVTGSIEYYRKRAKDLLGEAPADPTAGLSNEDGESYFFGNVAAMQGQGVDVQVTSININGRFHWQTDWLFSYAGSKITKYLLQAGNAAISNLQLSSFYINPVEGRPVYSVYSYAWAGLDAATGNPEGMLAGKVSTDYSAIMQQSIDSIRYNGSAQPVYFGAVRNSFRYKNFSLSFNISYRLGYYYRRPSIDYYSLFSTWNGSGDYALRWQKPGDEQHTYVPSMIYPADPQRDAFYQYSSVLVEKADNIRLEDISMSYDMDRSRIHGLPFAHVRVYLYVANLAVLYTANSRHTDPYYNNVPAAGKSIAAGVSITF